MNASVWGVLASVRRFAFCVAGVRGASPAHAVPLRCAAALAVIALVEMPVAHAQTCDVMQDLGTLPGATYSFASAVSANGAVTVGYGGGIGAQWAFRWTQAGGMQNLGTLPGGFQSSASAASADGSVVVGQADNGVSNRVFRWTASGGIQDIGVLPGRTDAGAGGVSADGSVVVGYCWSSGVLPFDSRVFRWTASGGMQDLGTLPSGSYSIAHAVSADGSVVVGRADNSSFGDRAFRWTAIGGMQDLGTLPGGSFSIAWGVSADGTVVVGTSNSSVGQRAFRWTATAGMQDLGTLPGGTDAGASGVSYDGTVVVGTSNSSVGQRAFRWTASRGMQDLGAPPGLFMSALSVSGDGSVVVGHRSDGTGLNGTRAFRWSGCGDTDGDGLPDDWELLGIPYTKADGTQERYVLDSSVPPDGISDAHWLRKDIFVEVDAMTGLGPAVGTLQGVIDAFDAAPVVAPSVPGGMPGIVLHTVVDEQNVPFQASIDSSQMPAYKQQWFGNLTERTGPDSAAILAAKAKAYRYCLFANRMTYPGSGYLLGKASGIPGTTFSVTLGGLPWTAAEIERLLGSTFMHELGHTLGLCHGGQDHTHYKPNYVSVMNYNFDELYRQSGSNWVRLPLDFSRESLGTLDETCLDENIGVSGSSLHTGVSVPFAHAGPSGARVAKRLIIGTVPVDWNADSATGSCVPEDITWFPSGHPLNGGPTPGDALTGFADWPSIKYAVPPEAPIQLSCAGTARVCDLTEELVIWQRLNLPPPAPVCRADFNGVGGVTVQDIFDFLAQWFAGSPNSDVNGVGGVTVQDVFDFLAAWFAGCS